MTKDVFDEMADRWPSAIVARVEVGKFSGGLLSPKTQANIDSLDLGCERITVGRKVAYILAGENGLIQWMRSKSKGNSQKGGERWTQTKNNGVEIKALKYNKEINIATAGTRVARTWKNQAVTLQAFVERLSKTVLTGETVDEFHSMAKAEKDQIKDCGAFCGRYAQGRGVAASRTLPTDQP